MTIMTNSFSHTFDGHQGYVDVDCEHACKLEQAFCKDQLELSSLMTVMTVCSEILKGKQ